MTMITDRHPTPWAIECRADTSAIVDRNDVTVLEVTWDGLQDGTGINAVLNFITEAVNTVAPPDEPEERYVTSQADFRQPKEDRD